MIYRKVWLWALACAAPVLAQPSVDEILQKYVQALGGREAYEKVTTRAMKGTVEIPDDNVTGTALVSAKAPGSYRLTLDIPGYGVVESVLDGANAWEKNPDSGVHGLSNADLDIAKRDHDFYRETRLKELFPTMTLAAPADVNGHKAYVIEAAPASGPPEKLYFDADTGLLVKRDFERVTLEDGIVQYEVFLSDYRDVDGVKVPATIDQRSPDTTMIFKFAEIKNNAPLADSAFAKPEKQDGGQD
jgi:hypothetical protein